MSEADTEVEHPPAEKIDVVIVPIAYNRNAGERNDVLDAAKIAKNHLASNGFNTWTDMRKAYTPSEKYQYWESLGVILRIEIGAKDVAKRQVVLANHDQQVKHPTGRMIAKRSFVPIDKIVSEVKEALSVARAKSGSAKGSNQDRGRKLPDAKEGTSLLDLLPPLSAEDSAKVGKKNKNKNKNKKRKKSDKGEGPPKPKATNTPKNKQGGGDGDGDTSGEEKKKSRRSGKKAKLGNSGEEAAGKEMEMGSKGGGAQGVEEAAAEPVSAEAESGSAKKKRRRKKKKEATAASATATGEE